MPGFPSSIRDRKTLEEFIVNFLWINVLHSTSNYPLAPDFIPTSPSKLYEAAPGTPALTPNQIFMNGDRASVRFIFTTFVFVLDKIFLQNKRKITRKEKQNSGRSNNTHTGSPAKLSFLTLRLR